MVIIGGGGHGLATAYYLTRKHGFKNVECIHHFKESSESKFSIKKSQKGLILYAGVLSRNKGVDFLIKSFKQVLQKYPDAVLSIVGDGPERQNLERLAKILDIVTRICNQYQKNPISDSGAEIPLQIQQYKKVIPF